MSDRDPEGRMETVASRVEFVELLAEEGPLTPRDIVDAIEYSRGTVTRALRQLREAGLVEKGPDGYGSTLPAVLAAREYRRYETTSRAIFTADDLLAPIPEAHAPSVAVLTGADTTLAEAEIPVRALEAVTQRVQQADTVRAYLPTLINTQLLRVWHRAVVGGDVESEAFVDPDLLTVLKGQYPHLLAEMAATDGFEAFATTGPPYAVIYTATGDVATASLVVYESDTALRGVLTNDSPAAVEWVRTELDRLQSDAMAVTADLDALSAAVADGIDQSPLASSGPAQSTGDGASDPGAGHALPLDLEAEGVVRLSEEYFEAHGEADPAVSWRTGFTLTEVRAGHALDREDAEGRALTDRLVGALQEGTDHVVLGPPGAGKSTVCMAVACEWFDRGLGPVLYREHGGGDQLASAALLEAYLRGTDGHALVVVEDAVRDEANAVFGVMQSLDADDSVTFLLDARTHEWHDPEAVDLDLRQDTYRRTAVEAMTVPALDERECERFVTHFSALVGTDLDLSGAELYAMVEAGTAGAGAEALPAGDALIAQHYLARRYDPLAGGEASGATALDEAARGTYRTLADAATPLALELGVLVALLTAADVPVAGEYCYAIAPEDEYSDVEEALSLLEGRLLFEHEDPRSAPSTYRTRHETWALRFLAQIQAVEPGQRARELVGRCITRLLALADDATRREAIKRHLDGRTPHVHQIEADPGGWADELADRIFGIGRTDASLAPLFGETTDDTIALPDACSAWTRLQAAYWRGEMNRIHGDLARAEREFAALGDLAGDLALSGAAPATPAFTRDHAVTGDDVAAHRTRWRATSRTKLGTIADDRGEYGTATEYHQEALLLFREIGDREGEAMALKNLGVVAFHRGDYDQAREYGERSRAIAVEQNARRLEAASLNNLATVAQHLGETDQAREYFEESLAVFRDLGDSLREAYCLNNLGTVAREQGDYERARQYHERSLAGFRDLGNRPMEGTNLTNLGTVARERGNYERAREYHERSLAVFRDLGDRSGVANCLINLGTVARDRGDDEQAREHYEESLAIFRDVGDRSGEAHSLLTLGEVLQEAGDADRAREYLEDSLAVYREIGAQQGEASSLTALGKLARRRGEDERARAHLEAALDIARDVGTPDKTLESLAELGVLARQRGDHDRARERFEAALAVHDEGEYPFETARITLERARLALARGDLEVARERAVRAREGFASLDAMHLAGRCRLLEGRIAAAAGNPGEARDHWSAALETFDEDEAPQETLATLQQLVETIRDEGTAE